MGHHLPRPRSQPSCVFCVCFSPVSAAPGGSRGAPPSTAEIAAIVRVLRLLLPRFPRPPAGVAGAPPSTAEIAAPRPPLPGHAPGACSASASPPFPRPPAGVAGHHLPRPRSQPSCVFLRLLLPRFRGPRRESRCTTFHGRDRSHRACSASASPPFPRPPAGVAGHHLPRPRSQPSCVFCVCFSPVSAAPGGSRGAPPSTAEIVAIVRVLRLLLPRFRGPRRESRGTTFHGRDRSYRACSASASPLFPRPPAGVAGHHLPRPRSQPSCVFCVCFSPVSAAPGGSRGAPPSTAKIVAIVRVLRLLLSPVSAAPGGSRGAPPSTAEIAAIVRVLRLLLPCFRGPRRESRGTTFHGRDRSHRACSASASPPFPRPPAGVAGHHLPRPRSQPARPGATLYEDALE